MVSGQRYVYEVGSVCLPWWTHGRHTDICLSDKVIFGYFAVVRRIFYMILSSLLLLGGCSREKTVPGYPLWRSSGNAEFDSLTAIVLDCHKLARDTSVSVIPRMEKIAQSDTSNKIMQVRLDIFRYSRGFNESTITSELATLARALTLVDSSRYPQDYNVLLWYFGQTTFDKPRGLKMLETVRRYFTSVGDYSSEAGVHMAIANIFFRFGEFGTAYRHFQMCDSLYAVGGDETRRSLNRISFSLCLPKDSGQKLMRELLVDSVCNAEPFNGMVIRMNLYLFSDSLKYLDSADAIIDRFDYLESEKMVTTQLRANYLSRHGRAAEALTIGREAMAMITDSTPTRFRDQGARIMSDIYRELGNADSALKYADESAFWRDSLLRETHQEEALSQNMDFEIERRQLEMQLKIERERILWAICGGLLIVAALTVMIVMQRRNSRQREEQIEREAELRRERFRMTAQVASLEEKERLISAVREIMRDSSDMPAATAKKLDSTLRLHDSTEVERESFMQIHDRLDPDFTRRLKEAVPDISEAQLRLAAYVASGMTMQQIARVLSISYDSVKKARYRLRRRLGLSHDDTLEDALRRFSG